MSFLDICFDWVFLYLSSSDIHNLKVTNKYWNKKIPKFWLKEKISFCHPREEIIEIPSEFRFLSFIEFIFTPNLKKIIIPSSLLHLEAIYISRGKNLHSCDLPKGLTFIHMDNCRALKVLEIPEKICVLQLMSMNLGFFYIRRSWKQLTTISLTNSDIKQLFIPNELNKLTYINLSGTNISEITFEENDNNNIKSVEIYCYSIRSMLQIVSNGVSLTIFKNPQDRVDIRP